MYTHNFAPTPPTTDAMAVEALYAMGHSLHSQERFADATAVFRIMLQLAPTDERSWLGLGECHERLGQLRIALEMYGAGTVANEHAGRCELARARVLRALDQTSEADDALDQADEIADRTDDAELALMIRQERETAT